MRSGIRAGITLVAVLALVGCADASGVRTPDRPSPFQSCPGAAGSLGSAGSPAPRSGGSTLPVDTLPCFTGGRPVVLAHLGRPAVINLWASWCAPCRIELPEFQRLADASGDRLIVLGVVTGDSTSSAAAAAEDIGITFPALVDQDQILLRGLALRGLGRRALPATLFVDAQGRLRHLYQAGEPLTLATLEQLTAEHLGVVVG